MELMAFGVAGDSSGLQNPGIINNTNNNININNNNNNAASCSGCAKTKNCEHALARVVGFRWLSKRESSTMLYKSMWEFPKIRGTLFWGPYNKDPTI